MEFIYEQLKVYLEEQLSNIKGWKKSKKQQKQFYTESAGATEIAIRMAEAAHDKETERKICQLWNFEIMPKMDMAIWGER